MNTWPLRGAVMLDIPSQYRPSYRNHARTSSETTPTLDTKEQWARSEWITTGSGDAHCHPAPSETVGNFKKHFVGDCAAARPTNPTILRHSNLPHPYTLRKQCPAAVQKPFVGITLERQEDALSYGNWKYGDTDRDEIRRDAHLDIRVHLSLEEPKQDSNEPSETPGGPNRLVVMGHSFPDRRLTQDVFVPRFLGYRASWQPPDLVYNVDSPLNPSAVQQLDIVKTWRRLSFSQAAEILRWEKALKLVITASVEALLTSSDGVQAKAVKSSPDDNSYVSLHLDPLKIVFDMIKSEETRKAAFGWFASTGNIHRNLLRFLRNQDCFIDPLLSGPAPYPCSSIRNSSIQLTQLPKTGLSDMGSPIQVELIWNPPYIAFESFDSKVEEGQLFYLQPKFCCALKGLFEDAISKGEIILTYSVDVYWLHYDYSVRRFSGTVPVRRRLPETKPSSDYILDIIVKAELVENFGSPTLEQTMRTQIRLMVSPRRDTITLERSGSYSYRCPDQSMDAVTCENAAEKETKAKESIICYPFTRRPLDVDIHNASPPASFPSHKDVSAICHCRHGCPGNQVGKSTPARLADTISDCVDPLKPAPLIIPKCRSSTLKKIQFPQHPTPSDHDRSVPRFDNYAADLEAKYSAWKFSKESKPARRADYFIDFATTPRQRPQRQLQSSNDGEDMRSSENAGCPAFQEELSDNIRFCLSKTKRTRNANSMSHPPLTPLAPPNGEASTTLSSQAIYQHNGRRSNRPFSSSDETTAYPSGGTTSGVDEIAETYPMEVATETPRPKDDLEHSQEPPLIRRDDALALLLRMRQIHEDERMSLGTNAEAIWFSSENTSEISLFESLDSWCSDHGTVFIVDDGEEADDEAEEAGNVGCGVFD